MDFETAQWAEEFRAVRAKYELFATRMAELISYLAETDAIEIIRIERRVKDVDSYIDKLRRAERRHDKRPEVTDLAGVRVIVPTLDAVGRLSTLIEHEFEVTERSADSKGQDIDSGLLTSAGNHFVLRVTPARGALSEWAEYRDVLCEVQARTVLQDAWSTVVHGLAYTSDNEIPSGSRASLTRVSVLMETADREHNALRAELAALSESYSREVSTGAVDRKLDAESLDEHLRLSDRARRLVRLGRAAGFDNSEGPGEASLLLVALEVGGISRIRALDDALETAEPRAKAIFERFIGEESYLASDAHLIGIVVNSVSSVPIDELSKRVEYVGSYWTRLRRSREAA